MLFVCVGFHGTSTVKNLTVKPLRIHSIINNYRFGIRDIIPNNYRFGIRDIIPNN